MTVDAESQEGVSVVIPCFNSGETIRQTVASVHAQTWPKVEIIVVDDGSTDPITIATLDALASIRLVRQQNAGLPAARNAGFRAASGAYYLPLDADDWLEPDAIERLVTGLREDPSADFACACIQLEGEAKGTLVKSFNFFEQLFLNQIPYCLLLPRSVVDSVGGYDESMRDGYEDWEFNIRLGAQGYDAHVVPLPLLHYRVRKSGMLISKSNRLHGVLWGRIQAKHSDLYCMRRLVGLWLDWRRRPSTYPLMLYFAWIMIHRLLPNSWFSRLFTFLRMYSHSNRVNTKVGA